jgi:uncharacterized membrane protein YphA (DoxX/SURF4 family)
MEPAGRYFTGIIEWIAGLLLLLPNYRIYGSVLGLGIMFGAIVSHLTVLGVEVKNDGGLLFLFTIIVFICCAFILIVRRKEIPVIGPKMS